MLRDPSLIPLSHQHQHGLALTVLIERGLRADPSPDNAEKLAAKVAAMADAELLGHFKVEETVLFPAVRESLDSSSIVDELLAQHREMETLIGRVAASSGVERTDLLQQFGKLLLSRHIRIEERQLFQEIQAKLPAKELGRLGRKIDGAVKKLCPLMDPLGQAGS